MREVTRTTHADALHQAGRRAEAEARFREAEKIQAERQPAYPLLYSVPGYRYRDLLLVAPERAVWQFVVRPSGRQGGTGTAEPPKGGTINEWFATCRALPARGADARFGRHRLPPEPSRHRPRPPHDGPRRALRDDSGTERGCVRGTSRSNPEHAPRCEFVGSLLRCRRRCGWGFTQTRAPNAPNRPPRTGRRRFRPPPRRHDAPHSPRRPHPRLAAVCHRRLHRPESAQADLAEAREIAERGLMRLFLTDILLTRRRWNPGGIEGE